MRSPIGTSPEQLAAVPVDRRDFGEIRFLLIDGELPRTADGRVWLVARVPVAGSLIADSGISYPRSLSAAELAFLERLGSVYRRLGIFFGGGDLMIVDRILDSLERASSTSCAEPAIARMRAVQPARAARGG